MILIQKTLHLHWGPSMMLQKKATRKPPLDLPPHLNLGVLTLGIPKTVLHINRDPRKSPWVGAFWRASNCNINDGPVSMCLFSILCFSSSIMDSKYFWWVVSATSTFWLGFIYSIFASKEVFGQMLTKSFWRQSYTSQVQL